MTIPVAARIAILLATGLASSSCGLISIQHCTYWNMLPAFGINYNPPVCKGGQPTLILTPGDLEKVKQP